MAEKIIGLIERIIESPIFQGAVIAYIIFGTIVVIMIISVWVYIFHSISNSRKRWK